MNKLLLAMTFFCATCKAVDLDLATKYTQDTFKRYESAVQECLENRPSTFTLTDEEKSALKSIQYSPAIIPYLEERAFSLCASDAKMRYIEALILLEKLNETHANTKVSEFITQHKSDHFHIVELEIQLNYNELPLNVRVKLESLESLRKPFNGLFLQQQIWPETK